MKAVKYTIYHEPVAQGRPRFAKGRAYDPPKSKAYKELVALTSRRYFPKPLKGALKVQVVFYMPMPKSWSKGKKEQHEGLFHTSRPDIDNLTKAVLDGLNGVAFVDDGQVAIINAKKVYSDKPSVYVGVTYDD